ncbi:hypothetical protein JCM3765_004138 [Sporobolomyces pararoseus]
MPPRALVHSPEGSDTSRNSTPKPLDKRQRRNPPPGEKRIRGRQGALKKVLSLPIDLILEICTHLDPGDLLVLSNTNKAFRAVVTGESSASLFRQARQRLGMPELLAPMSDLQYAALIFGKGCHFCGRSRGGKAEVSYRARVCGPCFKKEFIERDTNEYYKASRNLNRYTLFCVFLTMPIGRKRPCLYRGDLQRISDELDSKFPTTALTRETGLFRLWWDGDQEGDSETGEVGDSETDEVDSVLSKETRQIMDADWDFVHSLDRNGVVNGLVPNGEFQNWYLEHFKLQMLRQQDAEALQTWLKEAESRKLQTNKQIRSSRREQIEDRFEALGFDKSEFAAWEFKDHLQVKSTRPLSDITWSTLVEPAVRQVLEDNRRKRLEKTIAKQYDSSIQDHVDEDHFPPSFVYVQHSSLASLLCDVSRNPPDSLIVPASIKAAAMKQTLELVRNRREQLVRAVAEAYTGLLKQEKEKSIARREEEEDEDENLNSKLTPIKQLSFTLPPLPSWIPRDQNDPITASDEQLATFLNNSPLARFECVECRDRFDTPQLFRHLSSPQGCRFSTAEVDTRRCNVVRSITTQEWIAVEGFDNVEKPLVRVNPEVLSLSLKLDQLFESTPLVIDQSAKLPDLGPKYKIPEDDSESLQVELRCDCPTSGWSNRKDPRGMYNHISECRDEIDINSHRVRSFVDYSWDYHLKYVEARRKKRENEGGSSWQEEEVEYRRAEREARDIQQAIENSLRSDSRSSLPTSRYQPVASTSESTLDDRPHKRVKKEEGKFGAKFNDDDGELPLNQQQLRRDAAGMSWELDLVQRHRVLSKALKLYSQFGSPNRKLWAKPPPQAERWDEGLAKYRRGALRMTRTPGRRRSKQANCISLNDLIKPQSMLGMFSNTFLLEFDFLAPLLPILDSSHSRRPVPVFLAQPLIPDPLLNLACSQAGVAPISQERRHLKVAEAKVVTPVLSQIYQEVVGRNLIAIHPKCQGCSHSKIFLVRYPGFLLVIITSANTMVLDMERCDNHWYIQAFPELTPHQLNQRKAKKSPPTEFERILLYHLNELECPSEFLSLLSNYDYSLASDIHLVVSQPGVVSTNDFQLRSIGRLGKLARDLVKEEERERIKFEVCCGSVGAVKEEWMECVDWLLRGKDPAVLEKKLRKRLLLKKSNEAESAVEEEGEDVDCRRQKKEKKKKKRKRTSRASSDEEKHETEDEQREEDEQDWKIVFPPKDYVNTLSEEVKETASNISSFWKTENWSKAPTTIKRLFYQYRSKEPGRLFHEKSILWLDSSSPRSTPPLLFYLGSHNFSAAAWGSPAVYGNKSKKMGLKTEGIGNYEIGIVIRGEKIVEMLEKGSKWEDIVTYERLVERFGEDDIPWVSPAWVKKLEQGENEQVEDE